MPAELHPFLQGLEPTLLIAHRGGAALAPENTMAAFELALEKHDAAMLEIDLHATSDGVLVIAHDETVERCTNGEGSIAELTYSQISELDAGYRFTPADGLGFPYRGKGVRIPRLEEVVRAFPELRLNIEIKPERCEVAELFAKEIRDPSMLHRVCCGSAHDQVSKHLLKELPKACHFYPQQALADFVLAVRGGADPPVKEGYHVLDMPYTYAGVRLVDEPLMRAARSHDLWVNVWTVDDPDDMRDLIALGVGGIMTDRPDLLRSILDHPSKA